MVLSTERRGRARGGAVAAPTRPGGRAAWQAYLLLRATYAPALLLFGVDAYFNWMVQWTQYLAPWADEILPGTAQEGMYIVGGVEIGLAVLVLLVPWLGGLLIAAWSAGIVLNLAFYDPPLFYDVALRDAVIAMGALALGRLGLAFRRGGARRVLGGLAAAALVGTAVGVPLALTVGDSGAAEGGAPAQAGGDALRTITVIETSFDLSSPAVAQEGEALAVRVDRPGTYTFEAVNRADIVHALRIAGHGVAQGTGDIAPGRSAELTVTLPRPGDYDLFCPIANHRQLGMDGTVVVTR